MQLRSQQATGNINGSSRSRGQNSPHMASPSSVAAQPPTNRLEEASSSLQQSDDDDHLRGSSSSGPFRYDMLESPRYEHQPQPQHLQQHPPQTHASDLQFNTVRPGNPDISHRVEAVHEINKIVPCDGSIRFDFPTHSTSSTSPPAAGRHSDSNAEPHSHHPHHFGPPVLAENVDVEEEQSYGTLVMGQGGTSKYLGPTAASEWLRDVSLHDSYLNTYAAYLDSKRHETTLSREISLDYHLLRSQRHRCPHTIYAPQLFLIHFLFTLQRPKLSHGRDMIFSPGYLIDTTPTCLLTVTTVPSAGSE